MRHHAQGTPTPQPPKMQGGRLILEWNDPCVCVQDDVLLLPRTPPPACDSDMHLDTQVLDLHYFSPEKGDLTASLARTTRASASAGRACSSLAPPDLASFNPRGLGLGPVLRFRLTLVRVPCAPCPFPWSGRSIPSSAATGLELLPSSSSLSRACSGCHHVKGKEARGPSSGAKGGTQAGIVRGDATEMLHQHSEAGAASPLQPREASAQGSFSSLRYQPGEVLTAWSICLSR